METCGKRAVQIGRMLEAKLPDNECRCDECATGCLRGFPGWFAPGEVPRLAAHLKITVPELFTRYLAVDYWVNGVDEYPNDVLVLTPANYLITPGSVVPYSKPRSRCRFYDRALGCGIHAVKPAECRVVSHKISAGQILAEHYHRWRENLVRRWVAYQPGVEALRDGTWDGEKI